MEEFLCMELYHKVIQADVCRPGIDCKLFWPSFGDINLIHNGVILFGSGFSLRVGVPLLHAYYLVAVRSGIIHNLIFCLYSLSFLFKLT
jgi:hypothetical protein